MKKLILLLLIVPLMTIGQTKEGMEICLALQSNNFMSNTEAERTLDKILNTIGASKNFVVTPCGEISNAAAISYKGIRYILYNKEFMQLINSKTNNWSSIAILAHEVGHHINGHTIDVSMYAGGIVEAKSLANKRKEELEADEFAGFVLARLGANLNNALSFTNVFTDKDDTYSTHPSKSKRVNAVRKGFNKAGGNSSLSNTTKIPKEYERKSSRASAENYFNIGMEKLYSNDFKGAISDFNIVINSNPNFDVVYAQRAYAKSQLNQQFGAISDYTKAIELNSNSWFYYYNRGLEYNDLGVMREQIRDFYKSISDFSKAIEMNTDYSDAYMSRGVAKFHLKKYYEAIEDYSKAIELNPYNAWAYTNRGNCKDAIKQFNSAIVDKSKAIELNPNNPIFYYNRGASKYNLKNLTGACYDFRKAASLGESDVIDIIRQICE